jgi:hypothetical protein
MKQKQLAEHQKQRDLVSIRRDKIDENAIQGFILDSSEELLALQYVYDFNLDGLMFLRLEDITEVKSSITNKFQKELLEKEGLLERVPFGATFALNNWRTLIPQLSDENGFLILECEAKEKPDFFIGVILKATKTGVDGRYFSGAANWGESTEKFKFQDITSCQVGTNYINVYQRHFQRQSV